MYIIPQIGPAVYTYFIIFRILRSVQITLDKSFYLILCRVSRAFTEM